MSVDVGKQRMPYRDILSYGLKVAIHKRVSKDKISCMELIIVVRIDWRSQQSIQIHGVDQLSLLLECVILLKRSRQRLVI